jgi:D-serine deaminase-like pyridoxal phosphate-dependent protein
VLIEVNVGLNRAGVEPGKPTLDLARAVAASPGLRFAGLMGWEGQAVTVPDLDEKRRIVEQSLKLLTDSAALCRDAGLPVTIVSCGGTGTYRLSSWQQGVTEVQAGGGIFCDEYYQHAMHVEHESALTILATVTSRPSPTRVVCDTGKKAMSTDAAHPRPLIEAPVGSMAFSAEHTRIELLEPRTEPRVGDKLEFVVGYTDTTTMLHDEIYATRDNKVEVIWPILGRGKLR